MWIWPGREILKKNFRTLIQSPKFWTPIPFPIHWINKYLSHISHYFHGMRGDFSRAWPSAGSRQRRGGRKEPAENGGMHSRGFQIEQPHFVQGTEEQAAPLMQEARHSVKAGDHHQRGWFF